MQTDLGKLQANSQASAEQKEAASKLDSQIDQAGKEAVAMKELFKMFRSNGPDKIATLLKSKDEDMMANIKFSAHRLLPELSVVMDIVQTTAKKLMEVNPDALCLLVESCRIRIRIRALSGIHLRFDIFIYLFFSNYELLALP